MSDKKNTIKSRIENYLNKHEKNDYKLYKIVTADNMINEDINSLIYLINKRCIKNSLKKYKDDNKLSPNIDSKMLYCIEISKNRVDYFLMIPKAYEVEFIDEIKEIWENVNLEKVNKDLSFVNQSTKYQLMYKKDRALSLKTNQEKVSLLKENLKIRKYLNDGEVIGIIYNFIPAYKYEVNEFKWKHKSKINDYKNGRELIRNINAKEIIPYAMNEICEYMDDAFRYILTSELASLKRDVSKSTANKKFNDLSNVQIMMFSKAKNKEKEKELCGRMYETFDVISEDNELERRLIKKDIDLKDTRIKGLYINMMSSLECRNFLNIINVNKG